MKKPMLYSFIKNEPWHFGLILFCLLRLLLLIITIRFPEGAALIDSRSLMLFATNLIKTGQYHNLGTPPGYPFFLALVSGWSTPGFVSTAAAQLLLTSIVSLSLVPIGTRIASRNAGLIAGWVYALSVNAALWSLTIMTETLYATMLVASLWLWIRMRDRSSLVGYAALGISLGAGVLVRNISVLILPVWIGMVLYVCIGKKNFRHGVSTSLVLTASAALVIAAWAFHNLQVHGKFIISDQGPRSFYTFNIATVVAEIEGITREQAVSQVPDENPRDFTINIVKQYPQDFLQAQTKGVLRSMFAVSSGVWARLFHYPLEMQDSLNLLGNVVSGNFAEVAAQLRNLTKSPEQSILLVLSILGFCHTILVYIAGLGIFLKRQSDNVTIMLVLLTVGVLLFSPGAIGQARFRIPAEPYLAIIAGVGWDKYRIWSSRKSHVRD